jgi:hypothetical protein
MQAPQISPDGRYWWDGRAWQPMPSTSPSPTLDPSRPSWLAEGAVMPGPPAAAPPPFAATFVEPAPPWASPAPQRNIIATLALWFGVLAGAAILLFGLLGIFIARSAPQDRQSSELTGAVLFIVIGAVVFLPTVLNLTGFGGILGGSGSVAGAMLGELGIVGVIYTLLMVVGIIAVLSTPVGTARYGIPLAGVVLVVRRAMQGKWAGAGAITAVWAVGAMAALATGH